jgi:hypothetical protein
MAVLVTAIRVLLVLEEWGCGGLSSSLCAAQRWAIVIYNMPSLVMRQHDYHLGNVCVYCRNKFPDEELTDEHIIARALNGGLVIRRGACIPCAKLSNETYENTALNVDLLVPRRLLALKKSRNRGRAHRKPLSPLPPIAPFAVHGGPKENFFLELPDEEYPNHFTLVNFLAAGRLVGETRSGELTSLRIAHYSLGYRRTKLQLRDYSTRTPLVNGPFAMMLAKIGYCYAVAERGFDAFDGDDIRDLLAGRRGDVYNFVGGCLVREHLSNTHLHGLYFRKRGEWLTVLVHLFASLNPDPKQIDDPYEVVVGRAR